MRPWRLITGRRTTLGCCAADGAVCTGARGAGRIKTEERIGGFQISMRRRLRRVLCRMAGIRTDEDVGGGRVEYVVDGQQVGRTAQTAGNDLGFSAARVCRGATCG